MTSQADIGKFIEKWSPGGLGFALNERQGAQQHFIELCEVLGVPTPVGGADYLFEKGAVLHNHQRGYADVFKRGFFAWEYKAPGRPLEAALRQLMIYALALENPPLLIVSDRVRILIHTHFNGSPSETHEVAIEDLADPVKREVLRRCFSDPNSFKPEKSNRQITEEAAETFVEMAFRLRANGDEATVVSHFLTQCVFSFFAEDVGLLPGRLFDRLVSNEDAQPNSLGAALLSLFKIMSEGGLFGVDSIPWFNGGLFKKVTNVPKLSKEDVIALRVAARLDWSAIDPAIFGTLFERGLDPKKRSQLGAHYTDPNTINRLVGPLIKDPLKAEWEVAKKKISGLMVKHKARGDADYRRAERVFVSYLERLRGFKILDPACGSGNFLYIGLKALKDLEHRANIEAEELGLQRQVDAFTGPANLFGIELNEYAAELARVTVWIGELQWRVQHGYPFKQNPILDPLDQIECRDALLNADGSEAIWPDVTVVIGNPPFVGVARKRRELGLPYLASLNRVYESRVPAGADFVCYWFDKALRAIQHDDIEGAGLVATNSIRGGASRKVLQRIVSESRIFEAWSDEPWVNEGAAVRVSLICFGRSSTSKLNGQVVPQIYPDLTAPATAGDSLDITRAATLRTNLNVSFQGASKKAKFEIDAALARQWLLEPNPNGNPNSNVLKPWANGFELSRRPQEQWIVDFGNDLSQKEASNYVAPYTYVAKVVKPERQKNSDASLRDYWWRFGRPRVEMREALGKLPRFIATVAHSKYRFFRWLHAATSPDQALIVFAREDDVMFGILQSRFHEVWSLRMGTSIGVGNDPRYTPTTCFETFPFPVGFEPSRPSQVVTVAGNLKIPAELDAQSELLAVSIARTAKKLDSLREKWINPPEWTRQVPEVVPIGMTVSPFPDRIVARDDHAENLKARTITQLYNELPAWLVAEQEALDRAVANAYGWSDYSPRMTDAEIVKRLLVLNRISADWENNESIKDVSLRLAPQLQQARDANEAYRFSTLQSMAGTTDRHVLTKSLFYLSSPSIRLLQIVVLVDSGAGSLMELPAKSLESFSKGKSFKHPITKQGVEDDEIFVRFKAGVAAKELQ